MVNEDVDTNAHKASECWAEEFFSLQEKFVAVGKAVDSPMQNDSLD